MKLRLATRGSDLALWQSALVRDALEAAHPGIEVVVEAVRTSGDRNPDVPLSSFGGTGIFTSELDRRVANGDADLAVHSLKDVPTVAADGLRVAAVLAREDPRDAFVPAPGRPPTLRDLPAGASVGTSSLRRRALLRETRPDLDVVDLRGNLDTRLTRLREGRCDAALLAFAGLRRLGREDVVGELLAAPPWLPAAGQGAIAVTTRDGGDTVAALCAALDHVPTRRAVEAERGFLRTLQGGCQVPVGALATTDAGQLSLHGLVASLDGRTTLRDDIRGELFDPDAVGRALAARLLDRGADAILADIRRAAPRVSPP